MDKQLAPEETGDIDETAENLLSEDELRVYTDGLPENDRTPTIQDSFVKLHGDPEITSEQDLVYIPGLSQTVFKNQNLWGFS